MSEGAERIVSKILADARAVAETVQAEAAVKAVAIETEAKKSAAVRRDQILEQARKEAAERKRRTLGVAQLEARKETLSVKQQLIEETFLKSLEQLAGQTEQEYFAILREMLLFMTEKGTETVFLSPLDQSRVPARFWEEVNQALKQSGKEGALTLSKETRALQGGFILQSGGVEINCSFASLLEMQRDELEPAVAKILFD